MNPTSRAVIIALVLAGAAGGFLWWRHRPAPAPPAPPVTTPAAPAAPVAVPIAPAAPTGPAHPLGTRPASGEGGLPALDDSDAFFKKALGELFGGKSGLSFLILDGFARRLVASINNLGNDSAGAELWPVNHAAGRFEVEPRAGGAVIGAANVDRYAAFVRFADGVDTQRAVALYLRLYPLFQRAYEELGYPGKYFNDRVIEVIDNLLATPDLVAPVKVKLVEVDGAARPAASARLYVYDDPALEAASSGQKILLRMGHENAAKLKAKLTDVRRHLVDAGPH
jgi:hypothetical protein